MYDYLNIMFYLLILHVRFLHLCLKTEIDWVFIKLRHVDILHKNSLGTAGFTDGHIPEIQPKVTAYYLSVLVSGMDIFNFM